MANKAQNGKTARSPIVKIAVCLILLAVFSVFGKKTGMFDSFSGLASSLKIVELKTVIQLLVMAAFVTLFSNLVQLVLHLISAKNVRFRTLKSIMESLVTYASVLIVVCWGLTIIGVNVSTIFASVGVLALILGFGAESLVADVVTGLFIVFENQFNVGDIVELDGFRGEVTYVGIRTLGITDGGGNMKIVNHSTVKNLINRSERGSVAVCDIGISYDTDLEEFEKLLPDMFGEIKEKYPEVFIGTINYSGVEQLADSMVVVRIVAQVNEKDIYCGRRILNKEMKLHFDKANIRIPYPQMTVHNAEQV